MGISDLMESGAAIPRADIEREIEKLKGWRDIYGEKGLTFMIAKTDALIEALKAYKPKPKKPRSFIDIQKDIDGAQLMLEGYRAGRKYELEADWKRNRDELQREYEEALLGNMYSPDLRHLGKVIVSSAGSLGGRQESMY